MHDDGDNSLLLRVGSRPQGGTHRPDKGVLPKTDREKDLMFISQCGENDLWPNQPQDVQSPDTITTPPQ